MPPEIGFLAAQGVDPVRLAKAASLAAASGTDAATALLHAGLFAEDDYYRRLAAALGAPYYGEAIPLGAGARYPDSLVAGLAPLAPGAPAAFVLAPRGAAIAELLRGRSLTGRLPAITTPRALHAAIFSANPAGIAAYAADELQVRRPDWSLKAGRHAPCLAIAGLIGGAGLIAAGLLPAALVVAAWTLVQIAFLAMVTVRIAAASIETEPTGTYTALTDAELPVYSVFVALHREARVVPRLVRGLARLDYPAAKLDIKFLIEAGDTQTASALAAATLPARFEVVTVPPGLPRTKPRALNAALPLARGACLVVYDAEDVPDPGQLRAAACQFARSPADTACLQGRLVIDNADDTWLTRLFALEYAALFDVLIPALATWHCPIPLGGTSTHFRTDLLRAVHGWDAWNVTEDADLGIRLARAGYRVGALQSDTLEEAPRTLWPWLRQRTRWMKGFLQTSLTHGRQPRETARRLGFFGSLCALALVPGTVASALAYPFLMAWAAIDVATAVGIGARAPDGFWRNLPTGTAITVFVSGLLAMMLPAALGCVRRGWWDLLAWVPLLPLYYLLVSLGAWGGLFELMLAPNRWNKTEHGFARTSRSGVLGRRGGTLTSSGRDPPPPRPAGVSG
nr:glycosyltransferase family 2 protein [Methylobacterium sp. BTF04]